MNILARHRPKLRFLHSDDVEQFPETPSIVHTRESEPTLSPVGHCPTFDVSQLGVFLPQPRLVREGAASIEYSDRDARNQPFLRFQNGPRVERIIN